jgi:hypothetical protein
MTEPNLFCYPYASFMNSQLPLLKAAALYFDKQVTLNRVGASWAAIGEDHHYWEAATRLKDAGILQTVTPADVLPKLAGPRSRLHHSYPRRGMAARLAQRQEDGNGGWSALPLESMSSAGTDHIPRGENS